MFNHIMDRALLTHLDREQIDSPCVCKKVISTYADTMLTLPVFNTGITGRYRHWTPWGLILLSLAVRLQRKKPVSMFLNPVKFIGKVRSIRNWLSSA
jgi:hypothetical protein